MEQELIILFKSLLLLNTLNIEIIMDLGDNNIQTYYNQLSLDSFVSSYLKKLIGQQAYNDLVQQITTLRQKYNMQPLYLPLYISSNASQPVVVEVPVPQIQYLPYYDQNNAKSKVKLTITNLSANASMRFVEVQYTYDQPQVQNRFWEHIYTTSDSVEVEVIPNKTVYFKARQLYLFGTSEWTSETSVLTQRDEIQPASPYVLSTIPGYKTCMIVFMPPTETDFDKFVVNFTYDSQVYTLESKNATLTINVNVQSEDIIQATQYSVDTSGNYSEPTSFYIRFMPFDQSEPDVYNTITQQHDKAKYAYSQIQQLNQLTTFEGTVQSITNNQIQVSGFTISSSMVNQIAIVSREGVSRQYAIIAVDEQNNQLFLNPSPSDQRVGDAVTVTGLLLGQSILQTQTQTGIENILSGIKQYNIEGNINPPNVTLTATSLYDSSQNFGGVRPGSIVLLLDSNGKIISSNAVMSATTDTILFQTSVDLQIIPRVTTYRVLDTNTFISTVLGLYYDKILATQEQVKFEVIHSGNVVQIDSNTGKITIDYQIGTLGSINAIKLFGENLLRYYDIQSVDGYNVYVTPDQYLQQFGQQTSYNLLSVGNVLKSSMQFTQNDLTTSISNLQQNVKSLVSQTQDSIQLKIVDDEITSSYFTIDKNRIVLESDKVIIDGSAIVSGTLDQTKVIISAGQSTIDAEGIKMRSGNIKLGQTPQNYKIELNSDGSGHFQSGNISWDQNGALNINAQNGSVTVNASNFTLESNGSQAKFSISDNKFVFDAQNVSINGNQIIDGTLSFSKFSAQQVSNLRYNVVCIESTHVINKNRTSETAFTVSPQSCTTKIYLYDRFEDEDISLYYCDVDIVQPQGSSLMCTVDKQNDSIIWTNLHLLSGDEVWEIELTYNGVSFVQQVVLKLVVNDFGTFQLHQQPTQSFTTTLLDGENGQVLVNSGVEYIDVTLQQSNPNLLPGNLSEQWFVSYDGGQQQSLNAQFIGTTPPKTARIYWNTIKNYSSIYVVYKLYSSGSLITQQNIVLQNLKQYRISVPITVKLGATSTILTERCLETIVTANVYKNGQLVSDLTPYTFIFEPDGAQVYENGQLVKNKRKYTVYDIYRSINVKCTMKCEPTVLG